MAAHTYSGNGGGWKKKYSIKRQDGLTKKADGKPYFFEYIKELPPEQERIGRIFESRTNKKGSIEHYELFSALDGILTGIVIEQKQMESGPQDWLILEFQDVIEHFSVECGEITDRFASDIMKRLLDPAFDPALKLRISPYSFKKDNGLYKFGLSAISGVDAKLSAAKTATEKNHANPRLAAMPDAEKWFNRATMKEALDFRPVSVWLVQQLFEHVVPKLQSGQRSASANVQQNAQPGQPAQQNAMPRQEPTHYPFPGIQNEPPMGYNDDESEPLPF